MKVTKSLVWIAVLAGGCGADSGACPAADLTVPTTQTLVSLSVEQRQEVCDATVCSLGGYGVKLSCSSGLAITVAASRQQCVAQEPTNPACRATVEDLLRCTEAIQANPCASTVFSTACEAVSDPACLVFTT